MRPAILALAAVFLPSVAFGQARLIALDSGRALYQLDPSTAVRTLVATVSATVTCSGLAYDCAADRLWMASTSNDSLTASTRQQARRR